MNGYLKIKTRIDNSGLKKEISKAKSELKNLNNEINDSGSLKSTLSIVNQFTKLAVVIMAVSLAVKGLKAGFNSLLEKDEQIKKDWENIKALFATLFKNISLAIGNILKPIVEKMINLIYKLLSYINLIAKAWFNVDLFAKNSSKSINKANKNAKAMSKTLLSFDEINKLDDNKSNSGSDIVPDLKKINEIQPPAWLQWILDNKDGILAFFAGLAGAIVALKISDLITNLGLVENGLTRIKALGIGLLIFSIIELISSLNEWINEMGDSLDENAVSWETFGKTIGAIGLAILALGVILASLPVALAGVIVLILGIIAKNWDTIKTWMGNAITWLKKKFGIVGEYLAAPIEMAMDLLDGLFKGAKQIISGIIKICKGDLKGGLTTIFKGIGNIIIGMLNTLITGLNALITPVRSLIVALGKVMGKSWTMDNIKIPKIKYLASGGIVDLPKKGVPLATNVVAGEAGREGVLPLTNKETMSELGREIAKWITINIDLTGNMNNRILFKEFIKWQNEQSFSRNGV